MTETIDAAPDRLHPDDMPTSDETDASGLIRQPAGPAVIAIELLTAHPGNVRHLSLASAEVSLTSITRILARPDAG